MSLLEEVVVGVVGDCSIVVAISCILDETRIERDYLDEVTGFLSVTTRFPRSV